MKTVLEGSHAVSEAVRLARVQVVSAYPITPQTHIVEALSEYCAEGTMDARFICVESEHSAMAAVIGASSAGVRTFTATSSQGLAYMHELLHWSSAARLPIVMAEVNRALAPGWNIWMDQTDSLAHRYACYNIYETADSRYLTVGALEPRFWKGICDFFDVPEYIDLQYDEGRREELIHFFRKAFLTKTRSEWLAIFGGMDVCIDGVLDLDEALPGEYARARDMTDADSPRIGTPIRLSETPGETGNRPPGFGEHTRSILAELGYGSADIQQMFDEGVI